MSGFVLDCSVTAAWLLEDEVVSDAEIVLDSLLTLTAHVPTIWHLEIGNVLLKTLRRGRISANAFQLLVKELEALPVVTDGETEIQSFGDTLDIARRYSLTTYDAAYLELAVRLDLPLATLDKALVRTAAEIGVKTIPDQTSGSV
ncbi:putative nucleic acid-binding protein [Rhizobium aquaticum]|uniref:Nucleic acid-binding protein n=1 Tax=Rhizobium aquaticum TaxID=1549636 RepID=A0ABV2IYQ0_9HYPH